MLLPVSSLLMALSVLLSSSLIGAETRTYIQYIPSDTSFLETNLTPGEVEAPKVLDTKANEQLEALVQQTAALSNALTSLQETIVKQKERELELGKESSALNLKILEMGKQSNSLNKGVIAGAVLLIGLLIGLSYWFQLRCFNQMAELSRSIPAIQSRGLAFLENQNPSTTKLLEAIHLLEHRIEQLQEGSRAELKEISHEIAEQIKPAVISAAGAETQAKSNLSVSELLEKGQMLLDADSFSEAAARFTEVLAIDPSNVEAHLKKGIALERMNRLEPALSCYEEVLRLNPQRTIASVYKSRVLAALHRYDEALSVYDTASGKTKSGKESSVTLEWLEASKRS